MLAIHHRKPNVAVLVDISRLAARKPPRSPRSRLAKHPLRLEHRIHGSDTLKNFVWGKLLPNFFLNWLARFDPVSEAMIFQACLPDGSDPVDSRDCQRCELRQRSVQVGFWDPRKDPGLPLKRNLEEPVADSRMYSECLRLNPVVFLGATKTWTLKSTEPNLMVTKRSNVPWYFHIDEGDGPQSGANRGVLISHCKDSQ